MARLFATVGRELGRLDVLFNDRQLSLFSALVSLRLRETHCRNRTGELDR